MTIALHQKVKSGGGSVGSNIRHTVEIVAIGTGSDDKSSIVAAVLADTTLAPVTFTETLWPGNTFTYVRDAADAQPIEAPAANGNPYAWEVTVTYVLDSFSLQPRSAGDTQFNFDIGTQSANLKYAIATPNSYGIDDGASPGSSVPADDDLIGFDGETIHGVDIDIPTFTFSQTFYVANSAVDGSYIAAVWGCMISPINNASFAGFDAGEVKFLGVCGTRRSKVGDWQLTARFAVSPNTTSLTIGALSGMTKKGWDYADVTYFKKAETVTLFGGGGDRHHIVGGVEFVRIRQVYYDSDFSVLGTGL